MPAIELNGIIKRWGDTTAVNNVSFAVEEGSFVVLLGPSGCGKSTTLRIIAGLEEASAGALSIFGQDMTHTSPAQRRISMVFQSYALFPHLSVRENILFGLKVRKVPASQCRERLEKVAGLVGLADLLDRKPSQLSGGQRQRVALARAIIAENRICLMDEPLSNLDARLRQSMRIEIRALQERLKMTVVYVTHDQAEAMSMADQVILMRKGCIEQEGTPDDLYNRPATAFAASFIGTPPMNLLKTVARDGHLYIEGEDTAPVLEAADTQVVAGIRPEHVEILQGPGRKGIRARLTAADYQGADTVVTARIGDQQILVRTPGRVTVSKSRDARLYWAKKHVHVFAAANGARMEAVRAVSIRGPD